MGRARPEPVGPGAQLSPPPPLPAGSLRLRLRLDPHPRFPVSTSWASNPHGRPDPSSRRLSSPDLQRSPSSRPPGLLLGITTKARTSEGAGERDQLAPSFQSPSTVTPGWGTQWDPGPPAPDPLLISTRRSPAEWRGIHWLPSAGSSRGIHSQVWRDRPSGSQFEMPPPRRSRARGDPPGPHLFPG